MVKFIKDPTIAFDGIGLPASHIRKKCKNRKLGWNAPSTHRTFSQKQIENLRNGAVPPGKVLNPYGPRGNTISARYRLGKKISWRENAMKRNRLKLKIMKAVALEQHELQQLARENATLAMETLIEISKNRRAPEATRIAASSVILDRGYGKASHTTITANITNGKANEITADELDRRAAKALKRIEELTNRTPKTGTGEEGPADLRKLH